jgi:cytochrome c553
MTLHPETNRRKRAMKMKTNLILTLGCLSLLAGGALAADEAAKPAAPAAAAPAAAPGGAKKIDWEHMSKAERKKYMKSTVFPKMKATFQEFDAKAYKSFSCATCHGKKATETNFKMPNPELPKLPQPTDRAGFMAIQQKKPEAVKFMGTKVKPQMAELLGLPEWTPQNPNGFGCYECHTKEGGAGPGAPAKDAAAQTPAGAKDAPKAPAAAGKPAGGGW